MANDLVQRYRRWFEYEQDSHDKVLTSLGTVPAAGRSSPDYDRALGIMAHIAAARLLWLDRFGAGGERPTEFFPKGLTLAEVAARVNRAHAEWSAYFDRLDDAELSRPFEYQGLDGKRFRNTIEDILTQLFGHSWYHRGQVAMLVRAAGGEPAATDFVFWTRQPIA